MPYSNLNNGKDSDGLDIIRTLQAHYGFACSVWIDNRVSGTDSENGLPIISLISARGQLRIELERESLRRLHKCQLLKNVNKGNVLALIKRIVDVVGKKVQSLFPWELHLPPNYSVENAMKSAWLILRTHLTKTRDRCCRCAGDSIANALLDMCRA